LLDEGILNEENVKSMKMNIQSHLEEAYVKSKNMTYKAEDWETKEYELLKAISEDDARTTGLELARVKDVGVKISTLPSDGKFHRLVEKIFKTRLESINSGVGIDWGTAEALAFASLIEDGYNVRISG
jgi:2-oxoglutarate dehydrogenase E1 component